MKKLIIILMLALALVTIAQARVVHNFTFTGDDASCSVSGFTKWDTTGGTATCVNEDFRWFSGGRAMYSQNLSLPHDKDITIDLKIWFGSLQRWAMLSFINKSSGTDILAPQFAVQFSAESDEITILEDGIAKTSCSTDIGHSSWIRFKTIFRTNKTVDLYKNDAFLCSRQINNSISENNDFFGVLAYIGTSNAFTYLDNIAISYFDPIVTMESDLVNNTINYNDKNITINYWADFEDETQYTYTCDLYVDGQFNQTDSDINLSQNQTFFVDWGDAERDISLQINCTELEFIEMQYNWTFDPPDDTSTCQPLMYKWDSITGEVDCSQNYYTSVGTPPNMPFWAINNTYTGFEFPDDSSAFILEWDFHQLSTDRWQKTGLTNKSSVSGYAISDFWLLVDINWQNDYITIYESGNAKSNCPITLNQNVWYNIKVEYHENKTIDLFIDDSPICSRNMNNGYPSDVDYLILHSYTGIARSRTDNMAVSYIDPLQLDTGENIYSVDTIEPRINIWSPLNITYDKTAGNVTANVTIYDPNLFAWNSTLRNSIGTIVHNFFEDNLNITNTSTVYDFTSLDLFPDSYTWLWTAWDSHTSPKPVKNLTWYFDDNNLIAEDDIVWEGDFKELDGQGDPATYFYLAPEGDKYKLKMTFPDQALSHTINISSPSGNLDFRPDDGWEGHFVYFPTERFVDHEGQNVESVDVTYLGNNKWNLVINHYNATDEVEFESIGDLNRRDKSASFVVTCLEIWIDNTTACSIYDNQTIQYYDYNSCGTTDDLPADDGDVVYCNYCTADWDYAETECQDSFTRVTYGSELLNNATCCQVTGIAEDCDAPANTTTSCAGIHTTGDVTGVVIDFFVELGIGILPFVGIMVIAFLGLVILPAYIKRRK